jgi:REP element-mobilizing transposase RayT
VLIGNCRAGFISREARNKPAWPRKQAQRFRQGGQAIALPALQKKMQGIMVEQRTGPNMNTEKNRKHLKRIPVRLPLDKPVIYFVSAVLEDRRRIFVSKDIVNASLSVLRNVAAKQRWNVYVYCFMPDHVHLVVSPRADRCASLSLFMTAFKSGVTRKLHAMDIKGDVWQDEFFDHLLRSDENFIEKCEYVRLNPVRRGLAEKVEDYPYTGSIEVL